MGELLIVNLCHENRAIEQIIYEKCFLITQI